MSGKNTRLINRGRALLITLIFSFSLIFQGGAGFLSAGVVSAEPVSGTEIIFDIAEGSVNLGPTYSGFDASGNAVSGTHSNTNKYKVIQSTSVATENRILLTGSSSAPLFDVTIENINCSGGQNKGLQSNKDNAELCGIRAVCNNYEDINLVLRLSGTNYIGRLHYSTNGVANGSNLEGNCNSSLTITSANGDGSASGKLYAESAVDWSAAIGGTDKPENTRNIFINGGTIYAKSKNTAAIGGGGNGIATIVINGGVIEAENNGTGATIGGGGGRSEVGAGANVTINGGVITSENKGYGTAIGAGSSPAKLGGTGTVIINGGKINATSANNGIAIGGGSSTQATAGGAIVSISGGTINASGIGSGHDYTGVPEITSIKISGGSINTTQMTHTPYVADGSTAVSLTVLNPQNSGANAPITSIGISNGYSYGIQDVYTDENEKIYLWYPNGYIVNSINDIPIITPIATITYGSNLCGSVMTAVLEHNLSETHEYQWQRKNETWENIDGAISSTYATSTIDGNHELRVIITETVIESGTSVSTEYVSSGVVIQHISAEKPIITLQPSLTYTSYSFGRVNETLTVSANVLAGYTYSYSWYHNDVIISDAAAASYSPSTALEVGVHSFYCIVTATRNDNGLYNFTKTSTVTLNVYSVLTSSAKNSFNRLDGALSSSVTADVNGEFTAYLELKYTPSQSKPMKLVFSGNALPAGTSIIFGDFSAEAPAYYYYTLTNAQSSVTLTNFKLMGTTESFTETSSDEVRKYQFTVRLPENNSTVAQGICSLVQGNASQSGVSFSYALTAPSNVKPSITVTEAINISDTVSVSFRANSPQSTSKLLTVSLLEADVPAALENCVSIRLNNQPPTARTGNYAVFSLGNAALTNTEYTLTLDGLGAGEYNVKISLSDSDSLCCPLNSDTVTALSGTVAVNAPKYSLGTELQQNAERIVPAGGKLKLKLSYRMENAASAVVSTEILYKSGNTYEAVGALWSGAAQDITLIGASGDIPYEISIPDGATSGTYRVIFRVGDTLHCYNFIIR